MLRLPGNTPFRGPQQVQQSFITNNQVRPGLTLFNSQDSSAVFGNLLTLPIGGSGLLYVEPLYVQGTGENSFPLLQKVLVNYGDRVGYADTLEEALDQVFGAGAGRVGDRRAGRRRPTDGGDADADHAADADHHAAGRRGDARNPALDQAVADIQAALDALADGAAQRRLRGPGPGARGPADRRRRLPGRAGRPRRRRHPTG